jgi:site-specific DNA-methyltransferase (adenine-specific)
MRPVVKRYLNKVTHMDCIKFLRKLPDNCVDSVVTDPPYGLNFMGKAWDSGAITFNVDVWTEVLRVLKHGGYLLSFGGTRTFHRLVSAIEDAGFDVIDMIDWIYGEGFPKGLHVGKKYNIEELMGWHTQLKPAHEPIVLAQKQLNGTVLQNIQDWGVGAMNMDECRVAVDYSVDDMHREVFRKERESVTWREGSGFKNEHNPFTGVLPSGRFPANLILSHHPECKMVQKGTTVVKEKQREAIETTGKGIYADGWVRSPSEYSFDNGEPEIWKCHQDCPIKMMGSVARFFYCAKPSVAERNAGLDEIYTHKPQNLHITVKPVKLMRYLIRLVTPRGGVVLDHFLGSGSTAIAAQQEGMSWLGCDVDNEYCQIARARIRALG